MLTTVIQRQQQEDTNMSRLSYHTENITRGNNTAIMVNLLHHYASFGH